mmetsp:Transcript_25570/g.82785  ORF Transcript_25570/g.82785 Transcript_25570/m.82785 type:complete len:84 (-) Transcript_25570:1172-1423(-)
MRRIDRWCPYAVTQQLMKALLLLLEDSDSLSRQMATFSLAKVFEQLRPKLESSLFEDCCYQILRRLDDCNDSIRLAACDCFAK